MVSNFLYNKSKFVRNLIQQSQSLGQYMGNYAYNFDDFEQSLRYYYMGSQCTKQNLDIQNVSKGVAFVEGLTEQDFQHFILTFKENETNIDLNYILQSFKQIRKINKRVMEILLKVLDIKISSVTNEQTGQAVQVVDYKSYLKLRYFFIDRKATKEEYTQLISLVILNCLTQLQILNYQQESDKEQTQDQS